MAYALYVPSAKNIRTTDSDIEVIAADVDAAKADFVVRLQAAQNKIHDITDLSGVSDHSVVTLENLAVHINDLLRSAQQ